MKILKRGATIN